MPEALSESLCETNILPEGKCKSFTLTRGDAELEVFVVHFRSQFYAYENRCPHTGINLNWQANQFLDITEQRIQCSTHGALFRITDGFCEWGPCIGQNLRPLTIHEIDGQLFLLTKDDL